MLQHFVGESRRLTALTAVFLAAAVFRSVDWHGYGGLYCFHAGRNTQDHTIKIQRGDKPEKRKTGGLSSH